jgi:hypothetical protein
MDIELKVLFIDAGTGFYRINRYRVGDFFGPVDLGPHLVAQSMWSCEYSRHKITHNFRYAESMA